MPGSIATNAASSGVALDRKVLKSIAQRSDEPGLIYLAQWAAGLAATGTLVALTLNTLWVWPAMALHGILLTVPAYAMSHETAHGTAFRTRWLNEAVLWVTSLIYMEEPMHRRYTHTNHHTFTWHVGKDSQMPFDTPMTLRGWVAEITGFGLLRFHCMAMVQVAMGRPSDMLREVTPASEMPTLIRNARIVISIYAAFAALILAGFHALLWFVVLPRLFGAPVMLLFTLTQHVELQENHPVDPAQYPFVPHLLARPVSLCQHEPSRGASSLSAGAVSRPARPQRRGTGSGAPARPRLFPVQLGGSAGGHTAHPRPEHAGAQHSAGSPHDHRRTVSARCPAEHVEWGAGGGMPSLRRAMPAQGDRALAELRQAMSRGALPDAGCRAVKAEDEPARSQGASDRLPRFHDEESPWTTGLTSAALMRSTRKT